MSSPLQLEITDVAVGGDGIARADDGRVVFVTGAVPGDRVVAAVEEEKPRHLHAVAVEIVTPSPDRTEPPCPHVAEGCGGCGWQHLTIEAQRRLKLRLANESLRRIGKLDGEVSLGAALPAAGFRTTVRAAVDSAGRLGFRAASSHDVVVPGHCLVVHPAIGSVLSHGRFPGATEVTVRASVATGEVVAVVDGPIEDVSVPSGVVVTGPDTPPGGAGSITEVVAGVRFRVSPRSFFQTRVDGAAALVAAVRAAGGGAWGRGRLVDLYGGVGLFAATVGTGMEIELVESNRSAAADARVNLPTAHVVPAEVRRWRPSPADAVIADPPRAGLGAAGVRAIVATGADTVVTVHCDAASFGRDAGLLAGHGWTRRSTHLLDLFPHTPHVELVSAFDRAPERHRP